MQTSFSRNSSWDHSNFSYCRERRRKLSFGQKDGPHSSSSAASESDASAELGKVKFGAFSKLSIQDEAPSSSSATAGTGAAAASAAATTTAPKRTDSDALMDLFQVEEEKEGDGEVAQTTKEQRELQQQVLRKAERKVSGGAIPRSPSNSSLGSKEDLRPRTASTSSRRSALGDAPVSMTPPKQPSRLSPFLTTQMQRAKEEFEILELKTPFSAGGAGGDGASPASAASAAAAAANTDLGVFFKGPPAGVAAGSSSSLSSSQQLDTITEQQHQQQLQFQQQQGAGILTASGGFVASGDTRGKIEI